MKLTTEEHDNLTQDEILIRKTVFIEEQGFENEFDEIDENAMHLIMYDDVKPIACCRYFQKEENQYIIGRLAVRKEYRGKKIGKKLLETAEKYIRVHGGVTTFLHAQCEKQGFYQRQGYAAFGAIELDEGCPHIWMKKTIKVLD